jgi:hypothetical protein
MLRKLAGILLILSCFCMPARASHFSFAPGLIPAASSVQITWSTDDLNDSDKLLTPRIAPTEALVPVNPPWLMDQWAQRKFARLHKLHRIFLI